MPGLLKAIKQEASAKHIPLQDNQFSHIYDIFNDLYRLSPVEQLELDFEKQLFTRGTGHGRVGLHTSAIIASDSHYCCREQVLSLLYKPRDMNKDLPHGTLRIFEEGNYVHRKWQRLFLRGGLSTVSDLDRTRFNEEYMLSFSPDAEVIIEGLPYIVEIKSMNEFAYKRSLRHQSGEKQCRMYMFMSGIPRGIVLMENKNNQDFRITVLKEDNELTVDHIARLEEIKAYYGARRVPDRLPCCKTPLAKRCLDCPMSIACWGDKEARAEIRLTKGGTQVG